MVLADRMKALARATARGSRGGRPRAAWGRVTLAALVALASCPSPALPMPDARPHAGVPTWHLGEGLAEGDSFTYLLCSGHALPSIGSRCLTARLEFVAVLDEWHGPVWVVQARFGVPGEPGPGQDAILRIGAEGGLDVSADARHGAMVSAVRETLLWIDAHAGRHEPRGLEVGDAWGDGALHVLSVGIEDVGGSEAEVASVGHPGRPGTLIRVADGFPFPLDAKVYDRLGPVERLLFEAELVAHSRHTQGGGHGAPGQGGAPAGLGEGETETETLVASDTRGAAEAIARACGEADGTQETVAELCAGAAADPAWGWPWGAGRHGPPGAPPGAPPVDARGDWRAACSGSLLEATCYRGVVTSADGATLGIDGVPTRLSLVQVGPGGGASSLLLSECEPGSWATVDIDDAMPIDAGGLPVAAVHCGGDGPVNAALAASEHATIDEASCASSEFALHGWAARGCGG